MTRFFIAVMLTLSLHVLASGQDLERKFLEYLDSTVDPDLAENAYFPVLVKEKLRWTFTENQQGRLIMQGVDTLLGDRDILMGAKYQDGKSIITVSAPAILAVAGTPPKITPLLKNSYALALTHQAIVMEAGTAIAGPQPDWYILAQQVRTWHKLLLGAVRPMREQGQPMLAGFIEADDVLKKCGDEMNCVEFVTYVASRSFF